MNSNHSTLTTASFCRSNHSSLTTASFCRSRRSGFSLVELLVVMGIIAMILGISVPVFAVLLQARSIRGGADVVMGAFMKYREKATASGRPVYLVYEHWTNPPRIAAWYVEQPAPGTFAFYKDPQESILPEQIFPQQIWLNSVVQYNGIPLGMPFRDEMIALCTRTGANTPGYNFTANGLHNRKAYIAVLMPDGSCSLIGKANVPSFTVDNNADGDIVLENVDQLLFIDINPATGRVRFSPPLDKP